MRANLATASKLTSSAEVQLLAPVIQRRALPTRVSGRLLGRDRVFLSVAPVRLTAPCSVQAKSTTSVVERVQGNTGSSADDGKVENVVVVGSGPAGYTAAIYCARANLKPVIFEGMLHGKGGQLMGTTEVENFPGFPEGVTGPELMDRMRRQAERWGSELYTEDVEQVDLSVRPFRIRSTEREVRAHSVIIATGATAKRLHLPSEQRFWSKGISACAICDGASPLFKNREVAVVGGGDSAAEEAVYLTKYCSHVHLLVRKSSLRASKAMVDRVLAHPMVSVHWNTEVEDAFGGEVLQGLRLANNTTGARSELPVAGLFYGIGHSPNSRLVAGAVELDEAGYVKTHHGPHTSLEGVFAAGDLQDHEWRQAITAAGSGCMAALAAERYLSANGLARLYKTAEEPKHASSSSSSSNSHASSSSSSSSGDSSSSSAVSSIDPAEFDINQGFHSGQYALRKLYHESERPIAVLYTSPTCGPCRTLKPILRAVMEEYAGKVHYVEIDIVRDQEIAEAAGVTGTPTVQLFLKKARLESVSGVKMKREWRALLDKYIPTTVKL